MPSKHLILVLICIAFWGCSQPPTDFERLNDNDPEYENYSPEGIDTLLVNFYSEKLLEIKWYDQSYTQQKYMLERKIDDNEFITIEEFSVEESQDSIVVFEEASEYGTYTYRVNGYYPEGLIHTSTSKPLVAKNWLKLASREYKSGNLIKLDEDRFLALSGKGGEIYSQKNLSWEKFDFSICLEQLAPPIKLSENSISVLCTSNTLRSGELGIFSYDIIKSEWSLTGILEKDLDDFELRRSRLGIISVSEDKILILGYARTPKAYYLIAELFDLRTKESEIVDPNLEKLNVRVFQHDSMVDPIGIELADNTVFVAGAFEELYTTSQKILIFDPINYSWKVKSGPGHVDITDIEFLHDGRIIVIDGTTSGFHGAVYNQATNSWKNASHETGLGYPGRLVKIMNGNVFGIDHSGALRLFDTESDSWVQLDFEREPGFNFQYSDAIALQDKIIVNNSYSSSIYVYRPSPDQTSFFE